MYLPPCRRTSVEGNEGTRMRVQNSDPDLRRYEGLYSEVRSTVPIIRLPNENSLDQSVNEIRGYYTGRGYTCHSMRIQNRTDPNVSSIIPPIWNDRYVDDFEFPRSFPIRVQEKYQGIIRNGNIINISGTEDFVIRLSQNSEFESMMLDLNVWYEENFKEYPAPEIQNLIAGGHYVAYDPMMKQWSRVGAVNWNAFGEVVVELLDFGGYFTTFVGDIRFIRKPFCNVPIQSIRAKIYLSTGGDFTVRDLEDMERKIRTDGNVFLMLTMDDDVDPAMSKRVLSVFFMFDSFGYMHRQNPI